MKPDFQTNTSVKSGLLKIDIEQMQRACGDTEFTHDAFAFIKLQFPVGRGHGECTRKTNCHTVAAVDAFFFLKPGFDTTLAGSPLGFAGWIPMAALVVLLIWKKQLPVAEPEVQAS